MKTLVTTVKALRKDNKATLCKDHFADNKEFLAYTKAVDTMQIALIKWARADRQGVETKEITDEVFASVKAVLEIFSDEDFRIKADATSVRALRDNAVNFKSEYSEEYTKAVKRVKSFADSIEIHLDDLAEKGVIIPRFSKYAELIDFAEDNKADMLVNAINSYVKACEKVEDIKATTQWTWLEPYASNKGRFRLTTENFIADRAEKTEFATLDIEAIRAARKAKNKARREAKKAQANA